MNSKTTGIWFVIAVVLAGFIFVFEHYWNRQPAGPAPILSVRPADVTAIQIGSPTALEIDAIRTNHSWQLIRPIAYPARTTAIDGLLDVLQKLVPATRIGAEEHASEADYGFSDPQFSITIEAGGQRNLLQIGKKTAPGDQVFLRIVGANGVYVADADWLKWIPRSANDWRDTAIVSSDKPFDWIIVTNGTKVIELRNNPTNHLWRIVRPLQARADSAMIATSLQKLYGAQATKFVTDDAKADLSAYGLQPAELDLSLGRNGNIVTTIHTGKSLPNDTSQVYAHRDGWPAVLATANEPFSPWHGNVNDFRDPHLIELTTQVREIAVTGQNGQGGYTLQNNGTSWTETGEKFSVDADNVQQFIQMLGGLKISSFAKDIVTAPELQNYGLSNPARQIALSSTAGDTNAVIARLMFGVQTNGVFVRRSDEDSVYAINASDFNRIPEYGWEFRDRHIWSFAQGDVKQVTLRQNGKVRQMIHTATNQWTLATQGQINPFEIEETTFRFGQLAAEGWVGRNLEHPEKAGFGTNNLQVTFELKNGNKLSVDFGQPIGDQTALAAVTLDGERWTFVFPPTLYQFVFNYFTIPENVP